MAKDLFNFGRTNAYWADPDTNLCIITRVAHPDAGKKDRVEPSHPAVEKHERPISEEEIKFAEQYGIFTPIKVQKDGDDLAIVVNGRRRTRIAREVNKRRREANKGLPKSQQKPMLRVKIDPTQGDELEIQGLIVAENMQRANYTPSQEAEKIRDFMQAGADEKMAALFFGQKVAWIRNRLAILDCAKPLQKAVDEGTLSVAAAAELSRLPREQQIAKLEEASAAPKVEGKRRSLSVAGAKRAVAADKGREVKELPTKARLRKLNALLQGDAGDMSPEQRETTIQVLHYVLDGVEPAFVKSVFRDMAARSLDEADDAPAAAEA